MYDVVMIWEIVLEANKTTSYEILELASFREGTSGTLEVCALVLGLQGSSPSCTAMSSGKSSGPIKSIREEAMVELIYM